MKTENVHHSSVIHFTIIQIKKYRDKLDLTIHRQAQDSLIKKEDNRAGKTVQWMNSMAVSYVPDAVRDNYNSAIVINPKWAAMNSKEEASRAATGSMPE